MDPLDNPDRERTRGSNFGSAGKTPELLADEELVISNPTSSSGDHTFTFTPRGSTGGGSAFTETIQAGTSCKYSGRGIQTVTIDSADSSVTWKAGPRGSVYSISGPKTAAAATLKQAFAAAPTTTTTTSGGLVSTGFGLAAISPASFALLLACISYAVATAAVRVSFAVYRNATGVPAAGTAVGTDTKIGDIVNNTPGAIANAEATPLNVEDAAPPGGAVFYYIAFDTSNAADTVTFFGHDNGLTSSLLALYE